VRGLLLMDCNSDGAHRLAGKLSVATKAMQPDLADIAATDAAASAARACFGGIAGLNSAAGLTLRGSLVTGTPKVCDQPFAVKARLCLGAEAAWPLRETSDRHQTTGRRRATR